MFFVRIVRLKKIKIKMSDDVDDLNRRVDINMNVR
jgi:hypothetical protein